MRQWLNGWITIGEIDSHRRAAVQSSDTNPLKLGWRSMPSSVIPRNSIRAESMACDRRGTVRRRVSPRSLQARAHMRGASSMPGTALVSPQQDPATRGFPGHIAWYPACLK